MKLRRFFLTVLLCVLCLGIAPRAHAGGGPLGIDHRPPFDDSGIWSRNVQMALIYSMLATEGGIALWEGGDTRLGKTAWQAIDTTVIAGLTATGAKIIFSRERPETTDNPNHWFQGWGNESFPSGEVTVTSAIVTPFVLEYGKDHPWVYALEILPAYDAIARVKTWGHWQTDVIAGFALGTTVGYFMHERETPLILSVLPGGFRVGIRKSW
jgi:membrane-associated phospholipid phosphatase